MRPTPNNPGSILALCDRVQQGCSDVQAATLAVLDAIKADEARSARVLASLGTSVTVEDVTDPRPCDGCGEHFVQEAVTDGPFKSLLCSGCTSPRLAPVTA